MPDFATLYATFRGSKTFLVGLTAFVGIWLTFHFIEGFDADFGMLNTMLSTEASISLAFFTMVADQQSRAQTRQSEALEAAIEEIEQIGHATLAVATAERDILEDNSDMLRAILDHERLMRMLSAKEDLNQ